MWFTLKFNFLDYIIVEYANNNKLHYRMKKLTNVFFAKLNSSAFVLHLLKTVARSMFGLRSFK